MSTKIEWTNVTVNPFPGCQKVSPGCQNCYAEKMARRLKAMGKSKYENVVGASGWTGKVGHDMSSMSVGGSGKLIFVNSMGDLGYEGIEQHDFDRAAEWMRLQWQHTFQVLTKRPEHLAAKLTAFKENYPSDKVNRDLKNVWFGVTAENQEWADKRIPILFEIPASVRYMSGEPLLGPMDLTHIKWANIMSPELAKMGCTDAWSTNNVLKSRPADALNREKVGLDWIIVGPETGPGRRPCDNDWIKSIVDQCHASGVPVFIKAAPDGKGITKDINRIADLLGYPPEQLRQFPRSKS